MTFMAKIGHWKAKYDKKVILLLIRFFQKLSKKSLHIMKFVALIEINSGHAQVLSALSQASKSAKGRRLGESDHRTGFRTSLFSKKQD